LNFQLCGYVKKQRIGIGYSACIPHVMYVYLKHLLANWNSLVPLNVAVCGQKEKCSEVQVLQVKSEESKWRAKHLPLWFRDQRMAS